jgi:hypothetical protein
MSMFDSDDEAQQTVPPTPSRPVAEVRPHVQQSFDISRFTLNQSDIDENKRLAPKSDRSEIPKFTNSIAAAMTMRDEHSTELAVRKLKREREVEMRTRPDLVERDLTFGVFTSAAYRKLTMKNVSTSSAPVEQFSSDDDDDLSTVALESKHHLASLLLPDSSLSPVVAVTTSGHDARSVVPLSTCAVDQQQQNAPVSSSRASAAELGGQRTALLKRQRRERAMLRLPKSFVDACRERFERRKGNFASV